MDTADIPVILPVVKFAVCVDRLSALPSLLFPSLLPNLQLCQLLDLKLLICLALKLGDTLFQSTPLHYFCI